MSEHEAMHMMIMTQYLDTLKERLGRENCQGSKMRRPPHCWVFVLRASFCLQQPGVEVLA